MNNDILTSASTVNGENNCKGTQKQTRNITKFSRAHMIIPIEDMNWAMEQKPSINQFWQQCWASDPYGSRWMPLTTNLKDKTLKIAKAALRNKNLFDFKSEVRMLEGKRFYETYVINLHGSRRKEFWGEVINDSSLEAGGVENYPSQGSELPLMGLQNTPGGVIANPPSTTQTLTQQASQKPSVTSQERLSNSSKELLRRDNLPDFSKSQEEPTSLMSHLEAAEMGVMPSEGVIDQLRGSDYWLAFTYAAQRHGWNLAQWCKPTLDPEMRERRAAQLKELKEKSKMRKF